jgi:hypothetical protein
VAGIWSAYGAFADSGTYLEGVRFLSDRLVVVKTLIGTSAIARCVLASRTNERVACDLHSLLAWPRRRNC